MQVNSSFVLRCIHGKYILMPTRTNNASNDPILLNEVAAKLWKLVLKYQDRSKVLENIAQEYGVSLDSVEMVAVNNFMGHMVNMGLLLKEDGGI